MTKSFSFYQPTRIRFGVDTVSDVGAVVKQYGSRCLLVTTSQQETALTPLYERVKQLLQTEDIMVFHFDEVVPNPTVQSIEKAIALVKAEKIEVILGVGGGSSLDTAKAIALFYQPEVIDWDRAYETFTSPFARYEAVSKPVLPVIAVPTTAGTGSELTQAMIISDLTTTEKVCIFHDQVFPKEAIIDPALTLSMPAHLTAMTGFDAFCHAFESYVREVASVYTEQIGEKAIQNIVDALPKLMQDPQNIELRIKMSEAEMFAGISLANAAATIPHPLSEIIGGIAPRIPHGQALATVYPDFIRFQITKTPEKCAVVARIFEPALMAANDEEAATQLPRLIEAFLKTIGLDKKLGELGVTEQEMAEMEQHFVLGVLPFGTKDELTAILRGAFS